jgi:ADP-ribose pyrophosphatase YjhB (NUDIX family)
MDGYIKKIRKKIGQNKFIHPAARIIIENDQGEILFIHRTDNGKIGLPAGAFEEGEDITDCIKREVKEETGLELGIVSLIGISSNPALETVNYPNGEAIQYFTIEFYSNQFSGTPQVNGNDELVKAKFLHADHANELPLNERHTFISLNHFKQKGLPLVN